MELKELTLNEIGDGTIPELFAHELNKLLMNIDDPNTDPASVRKINIELIFVPSQNRDAAAIKISVTSKLAHTMPAGTTVHLYRKAGVLKACIIDPNQGNMFGDESPLEVVGEKKENEG